MIWSWANRIRAELLLRVGYRTANSRCLELVKSPDHPDEIRRQRISALLNHARRNVPFYADRMSASDAATSSPEAFAELPVLKKDDVEANFPDAITDEDVYGSIAEHLRAVGFDAVSTPEAGRLGESDESQLEWAVGEARVLVTFNVADFALLHHEWMTSARGHQGLIVSSQRPIGDLLRRLLSLAGAVELQEMKDRLEFLSNW